MKLSIKHFTICQNFLLISFLSLISLTVVAQANPIQMLPARDSGVFLYFGDQILKGKLPYKDMWDHKPPAIYYVNAIGLWIGRGSRLGIWFLEFFTIFLAAVFAYYLLRKLWGTQAALFGTLIWLYGLNRTLEGGNLTEEYSLPFSFLSILAFLYSLEKPNLRLLDILIGITFAINFLLRPNNAILQAAIVTTLILLHLTQRKYKLFILRLSSTAIGILTIFVILVIYFWQNSALEEFYNATVIYNITYSATKIKSSGHILQRGFLYLGISAWIALIGYITSCIFLIRSIQKDKFIYPINFLLLVGSISIVPLTDLANRTYSHYYMNWLPLIAISSGFFYHLIQTKLLGKIRFYDKNTTRDILIALLVAIFIFTSTGIMNEYFRSINRLAKYKGIRFGLRSKTSRYINNNTEPGELVYIWGGYPGENFLSRRDSPTPYIFYPLYLKSDLSDEINKAFLEDLITNHPVLIVDMNYQKALSLDPDTRAAQLASGVDLPYPPKNLYEVFDFIERNYYLESIVDGNKIFRLNLDKFSESQMRK